MHKRITRAYIAVMCLSNFSIGWVMSTYVLFLVSHDLSLFQANLLNTSFMLANFFIDPPTGYLADKYGQRRIHVLGMVCWALAHLTYGLGASFSLFICAELIAALGHSLISGALDSWIRNNTDEATTRSAMAKAGSFSRLAGIPSALLGSVAAYTYGLSTPYFLAAVTSVVAIAISVYILHKLPERPVDETNLQILPSFKNVVLNSWKNPVLRLSMFVAFVTSFAFQPFNMFWSVIMKEASGSIWWLGGLWVCVAIFISFGAYISGKDFVVRLNGNALVLTIVAIGLPIFIASLSTELYVIASMFLLHEVGRGALVPILFNYANKHIPSVTRSTMNSIRSSVGTLGAAAGLIVSGILSEFISPLNIWGIFSVLLIFFAGYVWIVQRDVRD